MPNYRGTFGHKNQTLALSAVLTAVPVLTGNAKDVIIPIGSLLGLFIHPDWDIHNPLGLWGRISFTDEYRDLIPHRSKLSHTPFLSTIVRFALTFAIPGFLLWAWGLLPPWWVIIRLFAGLALADALHVLADRTLTKAKKLKKKVGTQRSKRGSRGMVSTRPEKRHKCG